MLAGDWIDNGLPATIEGAIRSGNRAADLLHGRYLILRRGKRTVGAVDVQLA